MDLSLFEMKIVTGLMFWRVAFLPHSMTLDQGHLLKEMFFFCFSIIRF